MRHPRATTALAVACLLVASWLPAAAGTGTAAVSDPQVPPAASLLASCQPAQPPAIGCAQRRAHADPSPLLAPPPAPSGGAGPACDDVARLAPGADRCAYARAHCSAEGLLNYLTAYYCHVAPHGPLLTALMLVRGGRGQGAGPGAAWHQAASPVSSALLRPIPAARRPSLQLSHPRWPSPRCRRCPGRLRGAAGAAVPSHGPHRRRLLRRHPLPDLPGPRPPAAPGGRHAARAGQRRPRPLLLRRRRARRQHAPRARRAHGGGHVCGVRGRGAHRDGKRRRQGAGGAAPRHPLLRRRHRRRHGHGCGGAGPGL